MGKLFEPMSSAIASFFVDSFALGVISDENNDFGIETTHDYIGEKFICSALCYPKKYSGDILKALNWRGHQKFSRPPDVHGALLIQILQRLEHF
jgi:hypothetical protein